MFKSALLKLTGLYLLILMLVSLAFSVNLYRVSTHEVNDRLRRQGQFFTSQTVGPGVAGGEIGFSTKGPIEAERLQELANSQHNVLLELLYANIIILVVGGWGSYLLAKATIKPIEDAHANQVRFTADASHELRTPLAAMRTETEVALRDPKLNIKDARQLLASNVEELERLSVLSDGLLQLARGGDDTPMDQTVSLQKIVEIAVKQIRPAAQAKEIKIDTQNLPSGTIHGNETQLVQLLVILLDNAIKYGPGKQTVTISGGESHDQVRVSVADQGHGIPAHALPHIFERFYRVDQARSKANAPGHGLGLSIAEQIADAHGGSVEAASTPGSGSVFTITLPLNKS